MKRAGNLRLANLRSFLDVSAELYMEFLRSYIRASNVELQVKKIPRLKNDARIDHLLPMPLCLQKLYHRCSLVRLSPLSLYALSNSPRILSVAALATSWPFGSSLYLTSLLSISIRSSSKLW